MKRSVVVGALGTAQTLAWGSSYYLPAILADPIAHGLGLSRTIVFGLFSGALLLSAVLGPSVGRAIDNRGGRGVLALSNLVLATGLVLLGFAQGFATLALAWAVLGVGMAMGLYDPAFATLTGLYGRAARGPITGITLIAGFASTVGWPLSAFLDAQFGWRAACLIWAALHIGIGLPLNRLLIPRAPQPVRTAEVEGEASPAPRGAMAILAFVFAATWFVTGAMAAHLPRLLEIAGASTTAAIAAAALVGPAQVAARLVEFGAKRGLTSASPALTSSNSASYSPRGPKVGPIPTMRRSLPRTRSRSRATYGCSAAIACSAATAQWRPTLRVCSVASRRALWSPTRPTALITTRLGAIRPAQCTIPTRGLASGSGCSAGR